MLDGVRKSLTPAATPRWKVLPGTNKRRLRRIRAAGARQDAAHRRETENGAALTRVGGAKF